jgi:tetratricopeptide (TPR) repeat protein
LKAEIAEYTNDGDLKSKALESYTNAVKNAQYGEMYNKYNVALYSEDLSQPELALEIAKREIENRPTPQSYDLLAWSYFKTGDVEKANEIIEAHVEGQTSEPDVLYHIAKIYKAAGKTDKVAPIKQELIGSLYELGPTMATKINQL